MKSQIIAPKPLSEVTSEEWVRAAARLSVYVRLRLGYVQKHGLSIDDIVQEALFLTISGKRPWPVIDPATGKPKPGVDLLTFLFGVARSLASHEVRKQKRMISLTELLEHDGQERTDSSELLLVDPLSEMQAKSEDKIGDDEYRTMLSPARSRLLRRANRVTKWREAKIRQVAKALGVTLKRARYLINLLTGANGDGKNDEWEA